jgi:hypothetical protein
MSGAGGSVNILGPLVHRSGRAGPLLESRRPRQTGLGPGHGGLGATLVDPAYGK